ncbi:MAG: hypothetical protein ACE5FU_13235 [Nitrospinota bacterium]
MRGDRKNKGLASSLNEIETSVEIIDVSDYTPKRIPSKTWRECIKKVWEVDPLCCPKCQGEVKIIAFIKNPLSVDKILDHIGYDRKTFSRAPPESSEFPYQDFIYEPFDDGWSNYEDPCISYN